MAKKRKPWWEQESSAFKETKKIYEEGRKEVLAKRDSANKKGVWRTVRGRHVFIEEGKTLEQALGHKPGVENQKKVDEPPRDLRREAIDKELRKRAKKHKKDFVFRKQR